VRLLDGSGLSYENTVTVEAVLDLLLAAAEPRRPDLRPLLSELPVAGFTGSLTNRFRARSADDGRGLIRAKTGTLSGVHALAGVVVSRDGTLLGFTLLADGVRLPAAERAERALDRAAAALATCGCR
jgi:D-alanyl-D-alanine carboxypeptidase/D-alanyl-D-alanine-endopeptidase (penicillin-binding protein 4)